MVFYKEQNALLYNIQSLHVMGRIRKRKKNSDHFIEKIVSKNFWTESNKNVAKQKESVLHWITLRFLT